MPNVFLISRMALSDQAVSVLKEKNIWREECPVHHSRLVLLDVPYINLDGFAQIGQIMVLDTIKEEVQQLFKELANRLFPIQSLSLINEFGGDDVASMNANNSSAYNGRQIMNTNRWSSHAFGVAIDINPRQNPYLLFDQDNDSIKVLPDNALPYVNRTVLKVGMVEPIVDLFAAFGFTVWGGRWDDKPDYHHFQLPWDRINQWF